MLTNAGDNGWIWAEMYSPDDGETLVLSVQPTGYEGESFKYLYQLLKELTDSTESQRIGFALNITDPMLYALYQGDVDLIFFVGTGVNVPHHAAFTAAFKDALSARLTEALQAFKPEFDSFYARNYSAVSVKLAGTPPSPVAFNNLYQAVTELLGPDTPNLRVKIDGRNVGLKNIRSITTSAAMTEWLQMRHAFMQSGGRIADAAAQANAHADMDRRRKQFELLNNHTSGTVH